MNYRIKSFITAAALVLTSLVHAGVETDTNDNDVILAGHDAVAYFTEEKAVLGSANYTANYNGAVYRFASAKNRDMFRAKPAQYAPAYGGYCALGTSFGKKFSVDGKAFQVVEGRLYVNKNLKVYQSWKKDIPSNIVKAEGQWPLIEPIAAKSL